MYYKYLKSLLRHKWFVFLEACKLGIPWLGITHDFSKFFPREFFPYARYFYGGEYLTKEQWHGDIRNKYPEALLKENIDTAFDAAWSIHQKINRHHWQAWLYVRKNDLVVEGDLEFACSHIVEQVTLPGERPERPTKEILPISYTKILVNDSDGIKCLYCNKKFSPDIFDALPMPEKYIRELIADWLGAGRAYGNPDILDWYNKNKHNQVIHPETRQRIEELLNDL